jgi:hypothetical protein
MCPQNSPYFPLSHSIATRVGRQIAELAGGCRSKGNGMRLAPRCSGTPPQRKWDKSEGELRRTSGVLALAALASSSVRASSRGCSPLATEGLNLNGSSTGEDRFPARWVGGGKRPGIETAAIWTMSRTSISERCGCPLLLGQMAVLHEHEASVLEQADSGGVVFVLLVSRLQRSGLLDLEHFVERARWHRERL